MEARRATEPRQLGPRPPLGGTRQLRESDVGPQRQIAGVDLQDAAAHPRVGQGQLDHEVEPSRPQERRVDGLGPPGRRHHEHARRLHEVVQLDAELTDRAVALPLSDGLAARRQGVELVEEDHAGRDLLGALECLANASFRFAPPAGGERCRVDRDEMEAARPGERVGDERLARPRGASHQDAARQKSPPRAERPGQPGRELDQGLKLLLHLVEPGNVVPARRRRVGEQLTHRRRLNLAKGLFEVVRCDVQRTHFFIVQPAEAGRRYLQDAPDRSHARLLAEEGEVGADEAVRDVGETRDIDVVRDPHRPRVDAQDRLPPVSVGRIDRELPVEAARTAQSAIDHVRYVGGCDDDHLPPALQPIHQSQELGDDPLLHVAEDFRALWGDGVNLIDEDDRRRLPLSHLEELAQPRLALAVELVDDLGPVDVDEGDIAFAGDRPRDEGLARTGRAVEEDALGRRYAEALEDLRKADGKLHHLPDAPHLFVKPADVLVRRAVVPAPFAVAFAEHDLRALVDDHRALRRRRVELERRGLRARPGDREGVSDQQGPGGKSLGKARPLGRPQDDGRIEGDKDEAAGGARGDRPHAAQFIDADARVLTGGGLETHDRRRCRLARRQRRRPHDRGPASDHLDHIVRHHPQLSHESGWKASDVAADIVRQCVGHAQMHLPGRRALRPVAGVHPPFPGGRPVHRLTGVIRQITHIDACVSCRQVRGLLA